MIPKNTQKYKKEGEKSVESIFEEIYFSHFEKIKFYAQSYLRNEAQAKCVAQDVFLSLWEKMDHLCNGNDAIPLLFFIAKCKCINILRRESRHNRFKNFQKQHDEEAILYAALSCSQISSLYSKEVDKLYSKALEAMPKHVRSTFLCSRKEELKYSEIAHKQNISVKTVEYRISYAFRILRKYLKDYLTVLII